MELTIRTPYREIVSGLSEFSRVLAQTNEGVLNIQNNSPAAVHILKPGSLKIRSSNKDIPEELLHVGGFLVINSDNTCEITLSDAFDK